MDIIYIYICICKYTDNIYIYNIHMIYIYKKFSGKSKLSVEQLPVY